MPQICHICLLTAGRSDEHFKLPLEMPSRGGGEREPEWEAGASWSRTVFPVAVPAVIFLSCHLQTTHKETQSMSLIVSQKLCSLQVQQGEGERCSGKQRQCNYNSTGISFTNITNFMCNVFWNNKLSNFSLNSPIE